MRLDGRGYTWSTHQLLSSLDQVKATVTYLSDIGHCHLSKWYSWLHNYYELHGICTFTQSVSHNRNFVLIHWVIGFYQKCVWQVTILGYLWYHLFKSHQYQYTPMLSRYIAFIWDTVWSEKTLKLAGPVMMFSGNYSFFLILRHIWGSPTTMKNSLNFKSNKSG